MRGDATLFTRDDEVEAQWRICDPIVCRPGPATSRAAAAVRGRLARGRRRRTRSCRRATAGGRSEAATPTSIDRVWHEQDTTPAEIEAALRELLAQRHARGRGLRAGARPEPRLHRRQASGSGEIANRLAASAATTPRARSSAPSSAGAPRSTPWPRSHGGRPPSRGELALLPRDGRRRRAASSTSQQLDTIVDPLVVTDLATCVWSPHGHPRRSTRCCGIAQVVLIDSVDEPDLGGRVRRARRCSSRLYVVDLAWLRSTPWRERVAATFDPPRLRRELDAISSVTVRHRPDSAVTGLLLCGWLGSRLGWEPGPLMTHDGGAVRDAATDRRQDVELQLEPDPTLTVPGLAGITLETAVGTRAASSTAAPAACPRRQRDQATAPSAAVDGARRVPRRGRHPRRGHPPGAAARPDLRPGARPPLSVRRWLPDDMRQIVGDVRARRERLPADRRLRVPLRLRGHARWSRRAATSSGCACRGSDSPSVFGAILDRDAGGFRLGPGRRRRCPPAGATCPGTMVLETTWGTRTGWVIVRDVLLIGPWHHEHERSNTHRRSPTDYDADHVLLRTVRCVNGKVEMQHGVRAGVRLRARAARSGSTRATATTRRWRARRAAATWSSTLTTDLRLGFEGHARTRAHDAARGRHRVRRAVVVRAPGAPRPTTRPTSGWCAPPTSGSEWLDARRVPRPPVAQLPAAQRADAEGPDLRADRRDARRGDHLAARDARRRAQLGLPLLLDPRLHVHALGPLHARLRLGGQRLLLLHRRRRRGARRTAPDHVRHRRRAAS